MAATTAATSRRRPASVFGSALVALIALPALTACRSTDASPSTRSYTTLAGDVIQPLRVGPGRIRVLLFTTHDCPIANAYAPIVRELAAATTAPDLDWLIVHTDPDLTVDAARRHARDYELQLPTVLDPTQALAREVGATRTPEAAVLTRDGLRYRGRIDDRWRGLGQDGQRAEHEDLRAAIDHVRAGRPVAVPRTDVVGCLLPEPRT